MVEMSIDTAAWPVAVMGGGASSKFVPEVIA
jgi:hypothetical protein